jgi:hypothetical protein
MSADVTLTSDELWQAVVVGAQRRIACITRRKTAQHYDDPQGQEWSTEIEACAAELAVAKWRNVYWSGGVFDAGRAEYDAGEGRQVRHTAHPRGRLIIYPEDNPQDKVMLVTGKSPVYRLVGWLFAGEAQQVGKDHEWWLKPDNKRSPSWWVPQDKLRSFNQ